MSTATITPAQKAKARSAGKRSAAKPSVTLPQAVEAYEHHRSALATRSRSLGRDVTSGDVDVLIVGDMVRLNPEFKPSPIEQAALDAQQEKNAALSASAPPARKAPSKAKASSKAAGRGTGKGGLSLMGAARKVLEDADGPMSVAAIIEQIEKRKLFTYSDVRTPKSTRTYVQLDAAMKRGETVRVDKGVFDLKALNPRGAKKRPAAKAGK